MLTIVDQVPGGPYAFEFGKPLDPELTSKEHVHRILADWDARWHELWVLGIPEASPILLDILEDTDADSPRLDTLLRALGALGRAYGADKVETFLTHPDAGTRALAIRTLGQMGQLSSAEVIEPFLDNPDMDIRRAAIVALGKLGQKKYVTRLQSAVGGSGTLGRLAEAAKARIEATLSKDFAELTRVVIDSEDYRDLLPLTAFTWQRWMDVMIDEEGGDPPRTHAAELLGVMQKRKAGWHYKKYVAEEQYPFEMKHASVVALGRCRIKSSVDLLIDTLRGTEVKLRSPTVTSLGQIGEPEALDPLLEAWDDPQDLRASIQLALCRLTPEMDRPRMIEALAATESADEPRIITIDDSMNLHRQSKLSMFEPMLKDSSAQARRDSAAVLGLSGQRSMEKPLAGILASDPDPEVKQAAELSLKRLASGR